MGGGGGDGGSIGLEGTWLFPAGVVVGAAPGGVVEGIPAGVVVAAVPAGVEKKAPAGAVVGGAPAIPPAGA